MIEMRHIKGSLLVLGVLLCLISCEDLRLGDAGLSKAPETSGATLDSLFSSLKDADKVLLTAYSYLPYGIPTKSDSKMGGNVIEALTDLGHSNRNNVSDGPINLYYNGALNASLTGYDIGSEAYRFGSENDWYAIRYGWIFLENAHRIPDPDPDGLARKIGEAKMCIAVAYSNMLRYVGGVPILDHSVDPNEDMKFPRATFAQTVDFIVDLLDQAAETLPWTWDSGEDGRMTKAGALALKLRVLCFAASPTFNSDEPFHPEADEYHCYMNYDANRWTRAREAAEEFMRELELNGYYGMVQADAGADDIHRARRLAYRSGYYDRGTTETLISIRKGYGASIHNDYWLNASFRKAWGPTLNYADMFGWADGSDFVSNPDDPFEFDWENPERQPFFTPDGTGNPPGIPTRDPRLYENICVPGDFYVDGTVGPCHTNHPNHTKNVTGFLVMKYALQENADRAKGCHFSFLRFPEVLLNAAEAINESKGGPDAKAYSYVNQVRERVGLSPLPEGLDKLAFRKALLRERCCEFGYEEVRWFDMVRWGLKDDFQKKLYGLHSKGNDENNPTSFAFDVYQLKDRAWADRWDTKWYLSPIPRTEIDKNYGMTQNPGW